MESNFIKVPLDCFTYGGKELMDALYSDCSMTQQLGTEDFLALPKPDCYYKKKMMDKGDDADKIDEVVVDTVDMKPAWSLIAGAELDNMCDEIHKAIGSPEELKQRYDDACSTCTNGGYYESKESKTNDTKGAVVVSDDEEDTSSDYVPTSDETDYGDSAVESDEEDEDDE